MAHKKCGNDGVHQHHYWMDPRAGGQQWWCSGGRPAASSSGGSGGSSKGAGLCVATLILLSGLGIHGPKATHVAHVAYQNRHLVRAGLLTLLWAALD
jgi:hypothetical protein